MRSSSRSSSGRRGGRPATPTGRAGPPTPGATPTGTSGRPPPTARPALGQGGRSCSASATLDGVEGHLDLRPGAGGVDPHHRQAEQLVAQLALDVDLLDPVEGDDARVRLRIPPWVISDRPSSS